MTLWSSDIAVSCHLAITNCSRIVLTCVNAHVDICLVQVQNLPFFHNTCHAKWPMQ